MDAQQERFEFEPVGSRNDDLAVDDAALGQVRLERGRQLRKVAVEGVSGRGSGVRLIAIAEDDCAEAVPFGLEQPAVTLRDAIRELGQHGLDGRRER